VPAFSHDDWTVSPDEDVRVVDNPADERYELRVGDELAGQIVYRLRQDAIALLHTEVFEDFEGHGLGSTLVARALDDIRGRGLRMIPVCPFVRSYLERHPDQADLVGPRVLEGG
jgi:uncharacterized protein